MLNVPMSSEDQKVQNDLLAEIKRQTKNKISQITVRAGKVINRNIAGGIFVQSGYAVLYRVQGDSKQKVFLDRLGPGRLFFETLLNPEGEDALELVAASDCQIAIANLKQLQNTNRVLNEKITGALFEELAISFRGAMDQICTLRSGSAKDRLVKRVQKVYRSMNQTPGSDWLDIDLSAELLREMSGVSPRQFTRLLPELEHQRIMKVAEGSVFINVDNLDAQEIG